MLFFDALRVRIRDEGSVRNKAVYLALGIRHGRQPSRCWGCGSSRNEGARFWLKVMNELKGRGMQDCLIAVVDGLKGFRKPFAARSPRPQSRPASCT